MSDGPHRSLPMRRGWKHVAERGDNHAFAPDEVSDAIIPALEEDCQTELCPEFLDGLCDSFRNQEAQLFKNELTPQLETLRGFAGYGLGRLILDHAIQLSERGKTGLNGAAQAVAAALTERAARGARQVEEHYYRKSTESRALRVRTRIEEAIGYASPAIERLARRAVKLDSGPSARVPKKQGLDEGVRF